MIFKEKKFRVALANAGFRSVSALARQIGKSPTYVQQIGNGLLPPEHTRKEIADALGVKPSDIWV